MVNVFPTPDGNGEYYMKQRQIFTWKSCNIVGSSTAVLYSLPMLASVLDKQVEEMWLNYVFIEWVNPKNATNIALFKAAVNKVLPDASFSSYAATSTSLSTGTINITKLMNETFDIIIGITMFLCFFALSANMSANLYE